MFKENFSVYTIMGNDEKNAVRRLGTDLLVKMKYHGRFKEKEYLIDRNKYGFDLDKEKNLILEESTDPKVQYFANCKKELLLALPILDKVYGKTLCLQDYQLSRGHCMGIAVACKYFDDKLINRVLFVNNGMSGDEFAEILAGLQQVKEIKSITYK